MTSLGSPLTWALTSYNGCHPPATYRLSRSPSGERHAATSVASNRSEAIHPFSGFDELSRCLLRDCNFDIAIVTMANLIRRGGECQSVLARPWRGPRNGRRWVHHARRRRADRNDGGVGRGKDERAWDRHGFRPTLAATRISRPGFVLLSSAGTQPHSRVYVIFAAKSVCQRSSARTRAGAGPETAW